MDVGDHHIWTELRGWLHIVWGTVAGLAGWAYTSTMKRLSEVEQRCTQVGDHSQRALNDHMIQAAREYLTKNETQSMVDRAIEPLQASMNRLEHKLDRVLELTGQRHKNESP
jgi:hypothetical protein